VIAGDRTLSTHLAAESMIAEIARVLSPEGRVLAYVDSLVLGMAVLADQHHWPHLVDLPHAEVVLIPWPDGTITRCYGPDQLRELFAGAGLSVGWLRPLTVFSQSMVVHLLGQHPDSMPRLVRAELGARTDESVGAQLVVSGYKPQYQRLAPPGLLALAAHAARGVRPGIQPSRRDVVPAVDAQPVAALLDAGQRGQHRVPLSPGRLQDRLRAVILGQARARVGRIRRVAAAAQRLRPLQVRDRPVQLVAHFLQALTGGADIHSTLQELAFRGERPDQLGTVVPHEIDVR
jgi:hypothetical protein